MKNIVRIIKLALLSFQLSSLTLHADEGMWTMYNLPQEVYEQMRGYGWNLPYEDIYESDSAIAKCVVNFCDYCTGVVVSPDGLVFTNHHCGFEAIRSHSTVEHDYMTDGFFAEKFEDELPNEDMFVSFMVEQRDVTAILDSLGLYELPFGEQSIFIDSIENVWLKEVKESDSTLRLEIKPFFEGNRFYATTYKDYNDIRLVFTIPKSMGKFGGETDNWMWPRQTCDFSVFRIYEDGETFHPNSWAKVSVDGYEDGSFAMTVGYPGSTSRYLSSYGIRQRRDAINEPRAQVRGVKQEVMKRHMDADEAVRIKYDSKYAQSSNYWKNSIGMNKCIDSIGLIVQKARFEERVRHFVDTSSTYASPLDFDLLERLYEKRLEARRTLTLFNETFFGTSELATRAYKVHNGIEVQRETDEDAEELEDYVMFDDNSDKWDKATDIDVFSTLLENYREQVPAKYLPDFYATIDKEFGGDCSAYVNYLYKKSKLMKFRRRIYIKRKSFYKDCGVAMGLDITDMLAKIKEPLDATSDSIEEQERYLCDAVIRMEQDMPHYSDANFTMRLSYGQVGGYLLNGQPSGYYTTSESIVDKIDKGTEIEDYSTEPIMRELMTADDFSPYADKVTGKMHLCFLTNNDITGGNSGSPMFNGRGELIGLAFDGNWDSLSADIWFDSSLARCIGVDIRYVLYMMEKWGHADRLLDEIREGE